MKGQFIYKIVNTENGKFYVGSTTNTRERFRVHRNRLRNNRHHAKHLQAAWNKYGEDVFVFHVIETVPEGQSLQAAEDVWLQEHVGKEHCYNKSRYSDSPMRGIAKEKHPNFGKPVSEEQRQAISARLKEFYAEDITNHPRFGKQHSEETKARIKAKKLANPTRYWMGKERSDETRAKVGDAQRGKLKAPGRKVSPEGMAKIRAAAEAGHYSHWEGKSHTEESRMKMGKQVVAVLPDGTTREFITMNAAAQELGVSLPTIIRGCKTGKPVKTGVLAGWVLSYKGEEHETPHIPDEYKHLPRSRSQAKAEGAKEYFTGVPCTHGHIAPRKLKGTCTACLKTQPKEKEKEMKTEVVVNGVLHSVVLERFLTTAPKKGNSDWPKRLDLYVEDGEKYVVTDVYYVPEDVERAVGMLFSGVQDADMGRFWQEVYRCFPRPTVQALQSFTQQLKSLAQQP